MADRRAGDGNSRHPKAGALSDPARVARHAGDVMGIASPAPDTVHIAQFSGGAGSWGAAKRVVQLHGTDNLILLFADTLIEDQDTYRFLLEGAANVFGVPAPLDLMARALALPEADKGHQAERKELLAGLRQDANERLPFLRWIAEGRTPHEVFEDVRFLGNSRFDPCSKHLKRDLLHGWKTAHCDRTQTVCYVGIDWSEKHRYDRLASRWQAIGWRYEAPLCDAPYLTPQGVREWMRADGLAPPRAYGLGFHHNNCGGGCVKAGQGHWITLLRVMPERYADWEERENDRREQLGDVSMLSDRTGDNIKKPLTLTALRERYEAGRTGQIDLFDIGGCGCAIDEEPAA